MDVELLQEAINQASGRRQAITITVQEVNTLRNLADAFIYARKGYRSFDMFDCGLRLATGYMWVVREVIDQRIIEQISADSPTFMQYFNRNMAFVETGVQNGKNVVWDGVINAAIEHSLRKEPEFKLMGNIGTNLMWGADRPNVRSGFNQNNPMHRLNTAPLSMSDANLVLLWISRPSGFEEMVLFLARMAEVYYLVRKSKD